MSNLQSQDPTAPKGLPLQKGLATPKEQDPKSPAAQPAAANKYADSNPSRKNHGVTRTKPAILEG